MHKIYNQMVFNSNHLDNSNFRSGSRQKVEKLECNAIFILSAYAPVGNKEQNSALRH